MSSSTSAESIVFIHPSVTATHAYSLCSHNCQHHCENKHNLACIAAKRLVSSCKSYVEKKPNKRKLTVKTIKSHTQEHKVIQNSVFNVGLYASNNWNCGSR